MKLWEVLLEDIEFESIWMHPKKMKNIVCDKEAHVECILSNAKHFGLNTDKIPNYPDPPTDWVFDQDDEEGELKQSLYHSGWVRGYGAPYEAGFSGIAEHIKDAWELGWIQRVIKRNNAHFVEFDFLNAHGGLEHSHEFELPSEGRKMRQLFSDRG